MLTFVFKHPLLISLGFALIVLGLFLAWRKHNQLLSGHMSDGEVVALIPHRGSKGGINYTLRIAYTQADGTKAEYETSFATSPPLHQEGEKVRVVYYGGADTPDILAYQDLYLFPWTMICGGIFVLLMCAGFIYGPGLINAIYLPHWTDTDSLRTMGLVK